MMFGILTVESQAPGGDLVSTCRRGTRDVASRAELYERLADELPDWADAGFLVKFFYAEPDEVAPPG
jgi:hypothetical protein